MEPDLKVIVWFEEIGKADIPIAGGKGANLGELTRSQVPVPPGFVVTANAYFRFLEEAKLTDEIRGSLENLDTGDSKRLAEVANEIKRMISAYAFRYRGADQGKLSKNGPGPGSGEVFCYG